jgi:hypothetical protein
MRIEVLPPESPEEALMREAQSRQTWVVLHSVPQEIDDHDRERGVRPNPEWFDAFVPGDPDVPGYSFGGVGAYKLSMVQQWLDQIGLRRVDRTPDDHERIVEWWVPAPAGTAAERVALPNHDEQPQVPGFTTFLVR